MADYENNPKKGRDELILESIIDRTEYDGYPHSRIEKLLLDLKHLIETLDASIILLLGGVHYRGSVNYFSNLPSNSSEGDAYTVKYAGSSGTTPDGTEYVWGLDTDDNTYKWISFSKDAYSKAETETLLGGKQNVIDSSHKLDGGLVSPLTGYEKSQTGGQSVSASDSLNAALGKIEKRVSDDETNISTLQETEILLDRSELCNFYRVLSDGTVDEAQSFSATSYINCEEVSTIELTGLKGYVSSGVYPQCAFYDKDKNFISSTPIMRRIGSNDWEKEILQISVPDNAVYFRTTYVCMPNRYSNWKTSADDFYIKFKSKHYPNKKRPYQNGYIFFSQKINQSINQYWNDSNAVEHSVEYKPTTSVIALPESYTPNGKKTPVIMYFHGLSHYVYYDHWGNTDSFRTQKQHWLDMGFAVIDCNGARDNNKQGGFSSGGSRQYVDGYRKSWEYVRENYNVEDAVYVVGGSAGGIPAINYCYWFNDCKALFLLSPWTDLYLCSWQQNVKDTIVEYLGFANSATYEPDKTIGFDPALRIVNTNDTDYIYDSQLPPVKMIISTDESSSALYNPAIKYITALRNGGQNACVRYVSGLTHGDVVSGGIEFIDTEIANWFLSI